MLSRTLQIFLSLTAFSPILVILWLVKLSSYLKDYSFSLVALDRNTFTQMFCSLYLSGTWYLFVFLVVILLLKITISTILRKLTVNSLTIKSIKSSDFNINAAVVSYFLPLLKFKLDELNGLYFWAILIAFFIFALNNRRTYNFNPVLTLLFGYRHYEVATIKEVSYIIITRQKLINSNQITQYIPIMDYLIIDPTDT